jgi:hypothetical protein
MYIDESYEREAPFITLVGLIVPNEKWKELNTKLGELKSEFFGNPKYNLKYIRRKRDDPDKKWDQLSEVEKARFNEKFHTLLNENVNIIVALIDRSKMKSKTVQTYFKVAYSFLLERFEYFLRDFKNCYGSVVMDYARNSPEINSLRNLHEQDLENGVRVWHGNLILLDREGQWKEILTNQERREPLTRIVESLTFEKDDKNNFLQISDLIAGAFAYEYNRNVDKFSSPYKELLRKSPNGKVEGYGLKIFPK